MQLDKFYNLNNQEEAIFFDENEANSLDSNLFNWKVLVIIWDMSKIYESKLLHYLVQTWIDGVHFSR